MINVYFKTSNEKVANALRSKAAPLAFEMYQTIDRLMLELQGRVQRKASGEVLKSHRGAGGLLGSIRKESTRLTNGKIIGRVKGGGGPFWWLVVHEHGGQKTYEIFPGIVTGKSDKKALAFFPTGSEGTTFGRSKLTRLRFASGHQRGQLRPKRYKEFHVAGGVVVKSVEHPPLPKRSIMKSSLDEMRDQIIKQIYGSAAKALRE